MPNLFFFLSGEHQDLPSAELKAILEAEGFAYKLNEKLDQVLRLEADAKCIEALKIRAAFTRLCALELFNCPASIPSIIKTLHTTPINEALRENENFVVRVKHVGNHSAEINGMLLEQKLGEHILNIAPESKVKLRNPDRTFTGILTSSKFIFGTTLAQISAKPFVERRPRKRPFFHPSAMQAKLARCMVNLARPKAGETVLDPFCGTGTMLIEATLIGCRAVGLDVKRRMARGSLRNMMHFKVKPDAVIVTDARNLPVRKIDVVVTDPPYGTSSTTLNRATKQIIEEILSSAHEILSNGRRMCIAAPRRLRIVQSGILLGYKHIESHFVYVHRSLTREIVVFEKE